MIYQAVSLVGALLILVAYAGNQQGWLGTGRRAYHVLNFVGSGLLAWIAIRDGRAGFIALESIWALLSIPGMLRRPGAA